MSTGNEECAFYCPVQKVQMLGGGGGLEPPGRGRRVPGELWGAQQPWRKPSSRDCTAIWQAFGDSTQGLGDSEAAVCPSWFLV